MQLSGEVVRIGRDDSGIVCQELLYGAGVRLGVHAHESPFFGLTLDGSFSETVGHRKLEYRPRGVVYRGAGEEHSVAVGFANVRIFVVELNAAEIEQRYGVNLPPSLRPSDSGILAAFLTTAYREFRHPDSSSWLAIQGLILQLLVSASRTAVDVARPRWLDRVAELLHARFRSHLTSEEIAADVGVSAARVSTLFRSVYRRSLAEEQRRLRVEFACRRLTDPDAALADIALEAGFADQPHFSRTFKAVMGMTPAQYRDVLRGEGGRQQCAPSSFDRTTSCGCT